MFFSSGQPAQRGICVRKRMSAARKCTMAYQRRCYIYNVNWIARAKLNAPRNTVYRLFSGRSWQPITQLILTKRWVKLEPTVLSTALTMKRCCWATYFRSSKAT